MPHPIRHFRESTSPAITTRSAFTLVELLVAMAIFTALMSGIVILFVGSMRTVSQGRQAINGYEMARGTLMVLQDDLTTSFTARDYADVYNLYGSPIGAVFVGTTRGAASGAMTNKNKGVPGIARITYVLYSYRNDQDIIPEKIPGAIVYSSINDGGKKFFIDGYPYLLLRYVEPNVSDLTKFPDWDNNGIPVPPGTGYLEARAEDEAKLEFDEMTDVTSGFNKFFSDIGVSIPDYETILRAKRCQTWLTMLAGGRDPRVPAGNHIPTAWNTTQGGINYTGMFNKPARDYMLCENVVSITPPTGPVMGGAPGIALTLPQDSAVTPISIYSRAADPFAGTGSGFREIVFDNPPPPGSFSKRGFYGTSLFTYRPPEITYGYPEDVPTWWNDPYKMLSALAVRYYQLRSMYEANGQSITKLTNDCANEARLYLNSRLPTSVGFRMRVVTPATYPGAVDFNRDFAVDVNLPSAYARSGQLPTGS